MDVLRAVLVNPPPLAVLEPWYDRPDWGRVGLAYLAAYVRKQPGFEVSIVDAKNQRLDFAGALEKVAEQRPHVVGLTAFTNEIKPAAYLAALIKERIPNVTTVLGGVHVTALPEATLREFPSFDVGVVGEGEMTFHELCSALRNGSTLANINGLVYRSGADVVVTPGRERILDQDSIPYPAWDLLPAAREFWVQTLRGCPFKCTFCMNHNGRVARKRSVANVIDELKMLVERFGARRIRFGDELFTVDMDRTSKLADAMIDAGLHRQIDWTCQTHVRFVDAPLIKKMKKAGCLRVELGIETGDEEKLRGMGKGTNVGAILKAAAAAREAEMTFGTFFIIGHPNETLESIKKTIRFAVKMNPNLPMFGIMVPYPGTEVSRLAALGEGGYRLLSTDWDQFNKEIGGAMAFANLSRRQIEWLQISAYTKVFLLNGRWFDFLKLLWEYRIGAWNVLKKAMLGRWAERGMARPPDYDERLSGGEPVTADVFLSSRRDWEDWQRAELQRTKQASREPLQIVTAP